ncbi:DUF5615 family PIN-like protein [Aquimarina sp. 2201CG1-2-11]|uniref:DUF5615 family PIN-like protein n=1 Tax=Aquimarina discodermiae TaxID=3231043 RepID=UPI003461917C
MELLLDENLPRKLKYRFNEKYEVLTVPEMGWSGIKNGDLLQRMESKNLKVLLSIDKNMSHQQNLEKYHVSLLVFNSKDVRYTSLVEFIPRIEKVLEEKLKPGLIIVD